MTTVIYHLTCNVPVYKTYKTKPPKLLNIKTVEEVLNSTSSDPEQAAWGAQLYKKQLLQRSERDPNFTFRINSIETKEE